MRITFFLFASFMAVTLPPTPASAAALRINAHDHDGRPLSTKDLLEFIAPKSLQGKAAPETSGLYVTDLDGNPAEGRPWWIAGSSQPMISWTGASRVKLSLPWPVAHDGFSTVYLDRQGAGYSDGETVNLTEEIAATEYRLFRESMKERRATWSPTYKPGGEAMALMKTAEEAMAQARAASAPAERGKLFDKALTQISLAWAKALFEHGGQIVRKSKDAAALRWGLTLDDSLTNRLGDYPRILKRLENSGATWVRLVFRANPDDFTYAAARSFNEYDRIVSDLGRRKIQIMAAVLDSALWPSNLTHQALRARTHNLVIHYKDSIRTWEVASEPNGTCLGGCRAPLPEETVLRAVKEAAAEVKEIDPASETDATIYWWEGTAGDNRHSTLTWLKRTIPQGAFKNIDVVGLSVYPDDNPMGLAFDPVFRSVADDFPTKRLMLSGFGYADGGDSRGYWWLDPNDADGARKDLVILYTGAACAVPRSLCGGFWWNALAQLAGRDREDTGVLKIYRRTLRELAH